MSSTNVNIGFSEGRNSSRVLKPPGGGHSDIFGIREEKPKTKTAPVLPTNNITAHEINDKKNLKEEEIKNEDEKVVSSNITVVEESSKPVPTVQRVRVPPGGYSSGLW